MTTRKFLRGLSILWIFVPFLAYFEPGFIVNYQMTVVLIALWLFGCVITGALWIHNRQNLQDITEFLTDSNKHEGNKWFLENWEPLAHEAKMNLMEVVKKLSRGDEKYSKYFYKLCFFEGIPKRFLGYEALVFEIATKHFVVTKLESYEGSTTPFSNLISIAGLAEQLFKQNKDVVHIKIITNRIETLRNVSVLYLESLELELGTGSNRETRKVGLEKIQNLIADIILYDDLAKKGNISVQFTGDVSAMMHDRIEMIFGLLKSEEVKILLERHAFSDNDMYQKLLDRIAPPAAITYTD